MDRLNVMTLLLAWVFACWSGELSPEQEDDLAELRAKIGRVSAEIGREPAKVVNLSLTEASDWVEEFVASANLSADDPLAQELRNAISDLRQRAGTMTKPQPALKGTEPTPAREKLEELLRVEVDLKAVSFKRDVAPIIAESCLGCHNAGRKAGEFDASTFANFREQIEPGKPDESHLLALVTGKEQPRMPRGGAGFSPESVAIWTAWVEQGAKFDGPSPKASIADYLVSADAKRREKIARLSASELADLHRIAARRQIDLVRPQQPVREFESEHFLVRTTLEHDDDAEYVAVLGEAILEKVWPRYRRSEGRPPWPGRLGLVIFRDRYDYLAFARQVDNYEPQQDEFGHVRSRPEFTYVAASANEKGRSLDFVVAKLVLEAVFRSLGQGKMPDWAVHGSSMAEVPFWDEEGAPGVRAELRQSVKLMQREGWSGSLWDGNLPWVDAAPLATSLFHYLASEEKRRLQGFQLRLADGLDARTAVSTELGVDEKVLQEAWYGWTIKKYRK